MAFFLLAIAFLYVGRKVGWALSRGVLYTAPVVAALSACVVWGVIVALVVHGLIDWQQPGLIVRLVMGYALGAYVSIPNFGLFNEATIPDHAGPRHALVSAVPFALYAVTLIVAGSLLRSH